MKSIAQALAEARRRGVDRLDAQLLLAQLLARERAWLIAHDDSVLDAPDAARFDAALARRAAGEPLAYLVGHKEFHGLDLQVDARVLVPRPETELLVDWALELLAHGGPAAPRIIDLGTGSGAIALALKRHWPAACVTATDASAGSLDVARRNADRLALALEFVAGSWWQPLDARRFDLALSNPPYVRADDAHLAALGHEPRGALTPGPTGLEALVEIVAGAGARLEPGAWLLLEHGFDQATAVQALLGRHGFVAIRTRADLAGQPRCTGGQRPGR